MYIYESHLGGLYTSDVKLSFDTLYCEECGESDTELGYYDDDDLEKIWEAIKPYDMACIDCEKRLSCDSDCEKLGSFSSHNVSLTYAMKFLDEIYNGPKTYVALVVRNTDGKIIVNFKPPGHDFGECHAIPTLFCLKPELEKKVAISLMPFVNKIIKEPELVRTFSSGENTYKLYECFVEDKDEPDTAWRYDDGWYGYIHTDEYVPMKGYKFLDVAGK